MPGLYKASPRRADGLQGASRLKSVDRGGPLGRHFRTKGRCGNCQVSAREITPMAIFEIDVAADCARATSDR